MRHLVLQYAWRYLLAMQQRRRVSVTCFIKVLIPWEMSQNKDACLISSRKFRSGVQFQRFEPLVAQNVMGLAQVEKLEASPFCAEGIGEFGTKIFGFRLYLRMNHSFRL